MTPSAPTTKPKASNVQPSKPPSSKPVVGLSTSGRLFFGSLCVGTFGLGVWQLQRLLEKQKMIEERANQLQMEPTTDLSSWLGRRHLQSVPTTTSDVTSTANIHNENSNGNYRRRLVRGVFRYDYEVLVGPRGAPPGVQVPRQGLSAKQKGSGASSGAAPGQQGYHVLTPLEVSDTQSAKGNAAVVWVNRGWIPKTMLPQKPALIARESRSSSDPASPTNTNALITWDRPTGIVEITTVRTSTENPRMMTPKHDFSKRPPQLFWLDSSTLNAIVQDEGDVNDDEVILLTKVQPNSEGENSEMIRYPLTPTAQAVGNFRTTPLIHLGYAATWFGLSGAGLYMTRKLITRGRG